MPIVKMPDGQQVRFPDDMPPEEIKGLIASKYPELAANSQQQTAQANLSGQPLDGGTVRPTGVTATDQSQFTPEQLEMGRRFREQGGVDAQRDQFAANRPIASKAATFLQGIPFLGEFTDEAAGALSSNPDATELVRAMQDREARENPLTSTALQVGGGVAAALPAAAIAGPSALAALPESAVGKTVLAALAGLIGGGTEGAISGFGSGTDPQSRKENAIQRGAIGAGLGTIIGPVAPLAASGAQKLASGASRVVDSIRGRSAGDISQPAQEIIGRALGGDAQNAQAGINMARGGDDAMLADATQGTRDLLDASIAKSGPAANVGKQAVEDRASRANQNLRSVLDETLGAPAGVRSSELAIQRSTAPARDRAYTLAYNTPIDYASEGGQALESLLKRAPKSAFAVANKLMKAEGVSSKQFFARIDADGKVTRDALPNVRQIDYLTRALKEVADREDGKGKLGGISQLGRAFGGLSTEIRNLTKTLVPEYDAALETAADAISRRVALRNGQKIMSTATTRDEAAEIIEGMTGPELAALKQGIRSNLDDQMANVRKIVSDPNQDARQALKGISELSSDAAREKMALVLQPQEQLKLFREIDRNTLGLQLRAAVAANSKTAIRQATQDVVKDFTEGGMVRQAASGNPVLSAKRIVQMLTKNTPEDKLAREDELYSEIVNVLTRSRGSDARVLLRTLSDINLRQPIRENMARRVGQIVGVAATVPAQQELTRRFSP